MDQEDLLLAIAASLRELIAKIDTAIEQQKERKTVQLSLYGSNTPDDRYMS